MTQAMKTQKRLQNILNKNGFSHVRVINKDQVTISVDGQMEVINREDRVTGEQMSGLRFYAGFHGDHRMIHAIASDMEQVFNLLEK